MYEVYSDLWDQSEWSLVSRRQICGLQTLVLSLYPYVRVSIEKRRGDIRRKIIQGSYLFEFLDVCARLSSGGAKTVKRTADLLVKMSSF
jgi:hypothetical protein